MRYTLKQIHCRPWQLNGLSLKLVESHYENNYGGALRRLNAITEQLESLDPAAAPPYLLNGLKREELAALNSTLLHELYFASLGGEGRPTQAMTEALTRDFGSFDRWRTEFSAMGYALDMYEHAYHMDFGANARAYVDTFLRNVDWKGVGERYEDARKVAPPRPLVQPEYGDLPSVGVEEVKARLAAGDRLQVIDVRPRHSLSRQQDIAEGVVWRDPDRLDEWIGDLSRSEPVVVYCAYGFHVGCNTAVKLREAGFDAKYMDSGHSGWKAVGGAVRLKI
jgi:Fe-Mn family superoxide dismutase